MSKKRKMSSVQKVKKKKLTVQAAIEALRLAGGYQNKAAEILQCNRGYLCGFIHKHKAVKEALDDILEDRLDRAEQGLQDFIDRSDDFSGSRLNAIFFFLKTKGRHRGYNESSDLASEMRNIVTKVVNYGSKQSN